MPDTKAEPAPRLVSYAFQLQGTREYNVGEAPEASVLQELQRRQLDPPPGFTAQRMDPAQDIVQFDLLLVMDKFTAADVLREVGLRGLPLLASAALSLLHNALQRADCCLSESQKELSSRNWF